MHPLLQLLRLDRPIGIWLVYFPAAWAVALTATQNLWTLEALMLLGAAVMRAAGCIVNDLTDRELDKQVARTRSRPLASGAVSLREAYGLLALLLLIALVLALSLPRGIFLLALLALPMIAAYPWMKRITWWPQAFLGLTFNLSALFGWLATGNPLSLPAFTLYAASIVWTLGYDTIYAVQDIEDDAKIGIRSSARAVGARLKPFALCCYGALFGLLTLTGFLLQAGVLYYLGLFAASVQGDWQIRQLPCTAERAARLFRSNQWLGLLILAGILADRFTKHATFLPLP